VKREIRGALIVAVVLLLAGCGGEESEPTRASDPVDLSLLKGRIAFSAGTEDVYVVNADGTGLRRLTTTPGWDFDPSWSPDGRQIVSDASPRTTRRRRSPS
jgi:hypothetical protein